MLLSYTDLTLLVDQGVITNVEHDFINSASIDLTLGNKLLVEHYTFADMEARHYVELGKRTPMKTIERTLEDGEVFWLHPGQFVLAQTHQQFFLPNTISGEYKLKSSMARIGLEHLNAGWCDAGWNGSVLTLEFKNITQHHVIGLRPGDRIGQIVFFKHAPVPADRSYAARGRYNGDTTVRGIKE